LIPFLLYYAVSLLISNPSSFVAAAAAGLFGCRRASSLPVIGVPCLRIKGMLKRCFSLVALAAALAERFLWRD
jgi:hypothetical protein